jgi:hypothetical protein
MASIGQQVVVGTTPTLIFQCVDAITYIDNGYTRAGNPTIFVEGAGSDLLPLLLGFPSTPTVYLGGSTVTASGPGIGASFPGLPALAYNCHGGDSLYGIVGADSAVVSVLAQRQ